MSFQAFILDAVESFYNWLTDQEFLNTKNSLTTLTQFLRNNMRKHAKNVQRTVCGDKDSTASAEVPVDGEKMKISSSRQSRC